MISVTAHLRLHSTRSRGFTLLESLMACGVLLIMVIAVTSAVTAGQQNAHYAHQRVAGTLAAEEMLGRYESMDYGDLTVGTFTENIGTLRDVNNQPFPESFAEVGRQLRINAAEKQLSDVGVKIRGREIRVRTFDANNNTLADISRFIPEPASLSVPESEPDDEDESGGLIGGLLKDLFGW